MVTCIAAVNNLGVIGASGGIPWHDAADLRHFRRCTVGRTVVMGRATFESLGCEPLPNRRNIVVSRTQQAGVETHHNLVSALGVAGYNPIVIGGERLYRAALPMSSLILLSLIDNDTLGDRFFPPLVPDEWDATEGRREGVQVVELRRRYSMLKQRVVDIGAAWEYALQVGDRDTIMARLRALESLSRAICGKYGVTPLPEVSSTDVDLLNTIRLIDPRTALGQPDLARIALIASQAAAAQRRLVR